MSEFAVRARNLKKAYTLYPTPWDRMREIIGFKRRPGANFPEHVAVDGIDLDIRFGEKVAFIGRNGAGKSTLLKLITGVIEPTAGEIQISGETHALLQMGAGFHQDFTGRENARGYLANLGVDGTEADRLVDDIIEFAELEEYIDQPLKTYSTGMQMRLIFAASTTVAPKLFVVDEVLGVGDAYFQHKSFARIEELCNKNQTTLLLVSHDIYTAAKICTRMIWIDRGRIKYEGDPKTALNLYEFSIKEQEEQRLRRKATIVSRPRSRVRGGEREVVLVELRPEQGQLSGPIEVEGAEIVNAAGDVLARLRRGAPGDAETARPASEAVTFETLDDGSSWQYGDEGNQQPGFALVNYSSVYHKGVLRVDLPKSANLPDARLVLKSASDQSVVVLVYSGDQRGHLAARADLSSGQPKLVGFSLSTDDLEEYVPDPENSTKTRHGSGGIRITSIDILDSAGQSTRQLRQGGGYAIEFTYEMADGSLSDKSEMMIAIARDGVLDCFRAFNGALDLPARSGAIRFAIDRLPLANGNYVLSALLATRGYYASSVASSYTINDNVFDVVSRALEFVVSESHPAFKGTIVKGEGKWSIWGEAFAPTPEAESELAHSARLERE